MMKLTWMTNLGEMHMTVPDDEVKDRLWQLNEAPGVFNVEVSLVDH